MAGPVIGQIASTIQARSIDWLEPGYFARGKIGEITGDPSVGKSYATIDLAARLSVGHGLFDNVERAPANVVLCSFEDDAPDTIIPRLIESGADVARVRVIGAAVEIDGKLKVITLPDDIPLLEAAIRADAAAALIIDPVTACLSEKIDSHKDSSTRKVLAELAAMAQRTNAAVILVRHLNKQSTLGKALYRGGGSIAFSAAARTSFLLDFDPTDRAPEAERRRVLACIKNNLGPKPPSRAFRLRSDEGNPIARVEWVAGPCNLTADDLLRPRHERRPEALEEAVAFLGDFLSDGAKLATEVDAHAAELEISPATLLRARKKLHIRSHKKGFSDGWLLALPTRDELTFSSNDEVPPNATT
jgi:hypothetical protein